MFPAVSNPPILSNAETILPLPGVTSGSSSLPTVKNHQLQHLPHDNVIDCDSAGGVAISAFSVKPANASDCVFVRPGNQENEISDIGKVSKLTAGPYSRENSARRYLSTPNSKCLHVCFACDQEFRTRSKRNQHIKIMHPGEKLFVCAACKKKFEVEYSLQRHCKEHDGDHVRVAVECPECKKEFASAANMTRHMKSHNKDQQLKHTCDTCHKAFYRKDALDQHRLSHSGERSYVCDICEREFKTNRGLKHHMHRSHKVSLSLSPVCQGLLKTEKALNAHMQQSHNIKEGATGITKIDESAGKQGTDGAIASQAGTFLEKVSTHCDTCATRSETVQAWNEPFDELCDIAFNLPFEELDDIGPVP